MEKITIIGNACKAPERFTSAAGNEYVSFPVAVNKKVAGDKVTDFFDVIVFGKACESCMRYITKGNKVAVIGDLSAKAYRTKSGDSKVSLSISNAQVEFLSSATAQSEQLNKTPDQGDWTDIATDDCPF